MLMGFGSYGNGGGSSSSSSHLSALAPPFTVDRSLSKPLVDLTEPPLNWLNTHPLSFDSMHSSNAYGYSFTPPSAAHVPPPENTIPIPSTDSFLYGQNSDAILNSNLVEAKPFYPSYVSPTKYSYDDYAQSLSGLWDGSSSRGWEFSKQVELGENLRSKEMNVPDLSSYQDYSNQGAHSSKGLNTCEQGTNNIDIHGGKQHAGSTNGEPLDYKSFPGQISEFLPDECSGKSFLGSTSLFSETYPHVSCEQGQSRNHQTSYGPSHEKGAKQHSASRNDISTVGKCSPGLIVRSHGFGFCPSGPNTSSSNRLENVSNANNMVFSGSNSFSKMKDLHPMQSLEGKVHFDASQVSFHPDGGIHCFRELSLEHKDKLLSNVNVINDPLREKSGHQIPDIGPGCFSSMLASNGALNCLEGSSGSLDHYNPAVDSPCWKGASVYHFSSHENSRPITPPLKKKIEGGSNSIGPIDNSAKFSSLANDSESSPKSPSLANLLFEEHGNNSLANLLFEEYGNNRFLKTGSYDMKSSFGLGVQFSDYTDKPRQDHVLANNSVDEFKSFPMQQNRVEDKLTFDKKCELETVVADVGMSANTASEGCSHHVPFSATKHVLSSPSSVEAAPSKLTKLLDVEFAPQMCVRTLISTMHNLSELLLFHCSNEDCGLKENDLNALKLVVSNLDKCMYKTMVPEPPLKESLLTQKSTQTIRELPELQEGSTVSRPQDTNVAFSILNQSNYQPMREERFRHIMPGKKDERCSDFTSQGGDAERVKDDNMTQAIKKVLSENFVDKEDDNLQILLYKNLWLEAEAALCSVNYKARFDRMKIELEKCKLHKENTTELEKLSESRFSPDLNTVEKLPPEVVDDLKHDVSVHKTSCHPDDAIARYHILEGKESNANQRITKDVEKISSYNTSPDTKKVDKIAAEAKNDQTPHISTLGLPNSSPTSSFADDVEGGIMERFHILRNRIENLSCAKNMGDQLPQDGNLDGSMEPVFQQTSANHSQDGSTVKELHLDVKDDPMTRSSWMDRLGNQLPASFSDSSSSDWEHVLKEDLPGQNC